MKAGNSLRKSSPKDTTSTNSSTTSNRSSSQTTFKSTSKSKSLASIAKGDHSYKVYYQKIDKHKIFPIEEGLVFLSESKILLIDNNGEEVIEKPNTKNRKKLREGEEVTLANYVIEVLKPLTKSELKKESMKSEGASNAIDDLDFQIPNGALILDEDQKIFVEPFLVARLKPHQVEGVKFLYDCISGKKVQGYYGCILADSMGLGKSLTTLALIYTLTKKNTLYQSSYKKAIVICPATLIENWKEECVKWLGSKYSAILCSGKNKNEKTKNVHNFIHGNTPLLIISYDGYLTYSHILKNSCDILICDEGHHIKNSLTKRYQAIDSNSCTKRILLTGTPLQNYIIEFYTCVNLVNKKYLGEWTLFRKRYVNYIMDAQEPDADEVTKRLALEKSEELWEKTQKFMLRRSGEIIENDLPPSKEYVIFLRISELQEKIYNTFLHSKIADDALVEKRFDHVFALITMLRKIVNHPDLVYFKAPESIPLKKDWNLAMKHFPTSYEKLKNREEFSLKIQFSIEMCELCLKSNESLVLVSNFTKTLDVIENVFDKLDIAYKRLDGSTPQPIRMKIVNEFNNSRSACVLLLSSKAGGCGLNLIGASRLIMFDPDWNPANDKQAMSRIWREGQKKEVHIYRLIVYGTIEEKIYQRQHKKEKLSMHIVDAKRSSSKYSSEFLREIFTFNDKIESFSQGDDIKQLEKSMLEKITTKIEMVKEIQPDWKIVEEKLIVVDPEYQEIESTSSSESDFSGFSKKIKMN